jgi:hypothetical protein
MQLKEQAGSSSRAHVRDPAAIARLLDVRRLAFLTPFLGRECSVSQAASEVGASVARMAYQTARLVEVGLIRETRSVPRAGRAIRYYRSCADEFVISLGDVGDGDLEQHLLDAEEPMRRDLARSHVAAFGSAGVPADQLVWRVRRTPDGAADISPVVLDGGEASRPSAWGSWTGLFLSPQDAVELRDELTALWERWQAKNSGPQLHLLRLALGSISEAARASYPRPTPAH